MIGKKEIKNITDIVQNSGVSVAIWATSGDDGDLARVAEFAIENNVPAISCVPDGVGRMWPWLEHSGIEIYARFYMSAPARSFSVTLSEMGARIRASFRDGADGAMIFVRVSDLPRFVREILPVRDDLFFGKKLSIGLDISDVEPSDWEVVLDMVGQIRADAVVFALTKYKEATSDFVGRVYAAANAWNVAAPNMHFAPGANIVPITQASRLIQKLNPEIVPGVLYWVRW